MVIVVLNKLGHLYSSTVAIFLCYSFVSIKYFVLKISFLKLIEFDLIQIS